MSRKFPVPKISHCALATFFFLTKPQLLRRRLAIENQKRENNGLAANFKELILREKKMEKKVADDKVRALNLS